MVRRWLAASMECAACGSGDDILYTCGRCEERLCPTHLARDDHDCLEVCAVCGSAEELLYTCELCRERLCGNHLSERHHDCDPRATCAVCDTAKDLLFFCERCRDPLCATHHGEGYHPCEPADPAPRPTPDADPNRVRRRRRRRQHTPVDRPEAQVYPQTSPDRPTTTDEEALPPDAARPGYSVDRFQGEPVGPATTMSEWFRRQTYVSLSVKVGLIATLCNLFVYSAILLAMVGPIG